MQKHIFSFLVLFCIAVSISFPKSLGNKIHVKPLSDEPHYKHHENGGEEEDEHNADFDHDAFLGKDEADEFEELTPEESKLRLRKIVKKIDSNGDGMVSEDELREWLRNIQHRYTGEEVNKKWNDLGLNEDATLSWEQHVQHAFGSPETIDSQPDSETKTMVKKDELRWKEVDLNKDAVLNKQEYTLFLHPETSKQTQHIYAMETFEEIDHNKDGKVDMDEFLNDLGSGSEEDGDASWIEDEKNNFKNTLDKDHDGALDLKEVTDWLMQEDLQQVDSETEHLFSQTDDNKDKMLTEDEIADHYDVFVGSQATEYGDILHDEF